MSVKAKRPVITPEHFSGEQSWEDWIDQFESIASNNGWNDEQKLIWLKVHLTRRALLAYKKFSVTARALFKNAVVTLAERFELESRRDLYLAEFQSCCKKRTESWADFGEDLRVFVDKAYPMLEDDVRQQLALQPHLSQLCNDQVAFGVKQRKPKTIEAAVGATLELESYLVQHSPPRMVAPVQVDYVNSNLMDMMSQLLVRVERLEVGIQLDRSTGGLPKTQSETPGIVSHDREVVVCYRYGKKGHYARGCAQPRKKPSHQGN